MYPSSFTYHAPSSVDEALNLMQEHSDAKLMAGGHSLLPTMKLRLATPAHLIDMKNMRGDLQYVRDNGDHVAVGALTTYRMLEDSDVIKNKVPLIHQCLEHLGDMQVRNLGTWGGAIAHADPAGDPPAPTLALEATMVIRSKDGERTVDAADFFHGFFETEVGEGDILTEIRFPVQQGGSSYQKFRHPASGYAVVGVAVVLEKQGNSVSKCRVGITGVSDGGYRAKDVENDVETGSLNENLAAKAAENAANNIDPLEDTFADAAYRRQLAKALTKRALLEAWENA